MNWKTFYSDGLPKFVNIFKKSLAEQLDGNPNLPIVDYIKTFFDFYRSNSAFDYFKVFEPTSDKMYLALYLAKHESKIYIERDISFEGVDEEYQIQFELILDLPPIETRISEYFEVERNFFDDFLNDDDGYLYFEDFQEKVLSANLIFKLLSLYPKSIRIF